jgi:hypothetical protein
MRIKMVFMAASMVAALIAATITLAVQPFVTPLPFNPPQVDSSRLQAHVTRLSVEF